MTHLTVSEMQNWLALYAAAGICCAFALALSATTMAVDLCRERAWGQFRSVKHAAPFFLRTWWRWQKYHLLSTPVTLAIVGSFAATLQWS